MEQIKEPTRLMKWAAANIGKWTAVVATIFSSVAYIAGVISEYAGKVSSIF